MKNQGYSKNGIKTQRRTCPKDEETYGFRPGAGHYAIGIPGGAPQ